MVEPVKVIIVGAGDRGTTYAAYASEFPDRAQIVGVAEPREVYRQKLASTHQIPAENVFTDWRGLVEKDKFADAAIIATPDALHMEPAVAFANQGYHILLEKPMAPDEKSCRKIVEAALANDIIFSVCHVLRYTPYTQKLKSLIKSGVIGEVVSLQHLEPVGYWHQAHSFVRGNWRNEAESSFMLLAKSCHDIDWIRYIIHEKCKAISSFGSLKHLKRTEKPVNAGNRCLTCDYEPHCPYSAKKIYLGFLKRGIKGWPVSVVTPDVSQRTILDALKEGPYGRCVYECDNDVVDHQVVNMEFEGGKTATFTMTAFTKASYRKTRIFGTRGEIYGDGSKIQLYDFLTDETEVIDVRSLETSNLSQHGGGDFGVIDSFICAVAQNDPQQILSGPKETLESHLIVFAAEKSRREGRIVTFNSI
ncbi:MAG: Gfo/Idh/MocA family protein [Candidatus Hodarchaeales archaeon]|jgi:predicted dehydrogenase